jgi:hypothetical protein
MGNGQTTRLYSSKESTEVLNGDIYVRLKKQLERNKGKYIDFEDFLLMIRCHYERIVSLLYSYYYII